jgi:hypothetical protein
MTSATPDPRPSSDRSGRRRAAALPDRRGEVGRVQPDGGDGVAVWTAVAAAARLR